MAQPAYLLNVDTFDALRKQYGFESLGAFAAATGFKLRTLSDVRAGKRDLSLSNVLKLRRAFTGVSFDALFTENPDYVDLDAPAVAA